MKYCRWEDIAASGVLGLSAEILLELATEEKIRAFFYCKPTEFREIQPPLPPMKGKFAAFPAAGYFFHWQNTNEFDTFDKLREVDAQLADGYVTLPQHILRAIRFEEKCLCGVGFGDTKEKVVQLKNKILLKRNNLIFSFQDVHVYVNGSLEKHSIPEPGIDADDQVLQTRTLLAIVPPQRKNDWYFAIYETAKAFEAKNKFTPTERELWKELQTNPPPRYGITCKKSAQSIVLFLDDKSLDREAFGKRYKSYYPSEQNPPEISGD